MEAVRILDQVLWQDSDGVSTLFKALGVKHGFLGKGAPKTPPFHHCRQVHGTDVIWAEDAKTNPAAGSRVAGDGIFTAARGVRIAVKTADCVPVLLWSEPVVAAVHAGWRGLTAGILARAVETAGEATLHAAIGPAIGLGRYEVGPEVVQALSGPQLGLTAEQAALALAKGRGDRWHADLTTAAVFALVNAGVKAEHISALKACTYSDTNWHSYRRDGAGCGSNWSWIEL